MRPVVKGSSHIYSKHIYQYVCPTRIICICRYIWLRFQGMSQVLHTHRVNAVYVIRTLARHAKRCMQGLIWLIMFTSMVFETTRELMGCWSNGIESYVCQHIRSITVRMCVSCVIQTISTLHWYSTAEKWCLSLTTDSRIRPCLVTCCLSNLPMP